jgi:hypothetical protein
MTRLLHALAALPLLAGTGWAQPVPLSETQMDAVTAGETLISFDFDPSLVPGGTLVAKNQADQLLGAIVASYLNLVNSRLGLPGPP